MLQEDACDPSLTVLAAAALIAAPALAQNTAAPATRTVKTTTTHTAVKKPVQHKMVAKHATTTKTTK